MRKNSLPHLLSLLHHPLLGQRVAHLHICSHDILSKALQAEVTSKREGWGIFLSSVYNRSPQSGDLNKHSNLFLPPQLLLGLERFENIHLNHQLPYYPKINYTLEAILPVPEHTHLLFTVHTLYIQYSIRIYAIQSRMDVHRLPRAELVDTGKLSDVLISLVSHPLVCSSKCQKSTFYLFSVNVNPHFSSMKPWEV